MQKKLSDISQYLKTTCLDAGIVSSIVEAVSAGDVDGAIIVNKFGRTKPLSSGSTYVSIWEKGGLYTGQPLGAAEEMEILSSSSQDSAGIGTGAWRVTITQLIDEDGHCADDVIVDLDGTTPVSLGGLKYTRATRIKVLTAGTGGGNAGTLTLRHKTTTANIFATMEIGKNQTNICAFTVPKGKTFYVFRSYVHMARENGSLGSAEIQMRARPYGGVYNIQRNPEITSSQSFDMIKSGFLVMPERTDVVMNIADVSDNSTTVVGEFSGILLDTPPE